MPNQNELFDVSDTLVPCIACGGNAEIKVSRFGAGWTVVCSDCGASSMYSYAKRDKAATLWNMNNNPNRG